MNNILETAIKNKIAIEMIEYLGEDSIEDVPYNIEYSHAYTKLIDDKSTQEEILEYAMNFGLEFESDKKPYQMLTIATMIIFERYFNDDFVCSPFTIEQFKRSLKILKVDIWDVLEMKYVFNM